MQRLADRQREFAAALLDPNLPLPPGLVGPDGNPSPRRFAIYRNNVVVGLTEVLKASFPAVCRIVGEEFFRAMTRTYIVLEQPASPILLDYGVGFASFISGFEPIASLPYLTDVAQIERAWTEAYNAREMASLGPETLADIPNDQIADMRFAIHPSVRIVRSRFPALTIWRMNVANGLPGPVDLDSGGEDALVLRPATDVEVRIMPPGGAKFLTTLASGKTLAEAASVAMKDSVLFDIVDNIAALIGAGVFVGYSLVQAEMLATGS